MTGPNDRILPPGGLGPKQQPIYIGVDLSSKPDQTAAQIVLTREALAALPEVQALIRQAVEAEREACADVLHDEQVQIWADEIMYDLHHAEVLNIRDYDDKITAVEYVRAALRNIAAAIRKRGEV